MRSIVLSFCLLATAACTTEIDSAQDHHTSGGKADEEGYCPVDNDLIAAARNALIRKDSMTFSTGSFSAGRVENVSDLNGDGMNDVVVYPGFQYASGDEEAAVMLGDPETDCIVPRPNVAFTATEVRFERQGPDAEGGPLDIVTTSNGDCEVVTTWYAWNGTSFVAADSKTDTSACEP